MNFQYLPNIHTGRHAQGVQHNIQRPAVGQERHIFHWEHTGNHTLVPMAACHFVPYGNLTFLGNVNAHGLIYAGRKLIPIFPCKYFGVHYNPILPVGHFQGSVPDFPCLFTENRKPFLCRQLRFSLWRYLAHQNIAGTYLRANADNPAFIQILQGIVAHAGNVPCNFFRP